MELFFLAILVVLMATALGMGFPVAFALPGSAIISIALAAGAGYLFEGSTEAYFYSGGPSQWLSAGVTNLRGVYWEVERDTLIAIPLFIFMGIMLQRSKIAEDLLVTMAGLFGPIPGGLGISVVFVGALLAATTGIVGATVVAMGLISLPAMLRNNYSKPLATGTIAASGTLGQIIPPSIVLIILADQLASASDQASTLRKALHKSSTGELSMPSSFDVASTSAGEMFLGAFVPGILLVILYMIYILVYAMFKPSAAPAVPYEGKRDARFWGNVVLTLVPPLALIFLVLGSIISGIATVNQAGAIGAAGALVMAGYRLVDHKRSTYFPALLAIAAMFAIGFALANYNMNVKGLIATQGDMTGIWIGAFSSTMLIVALAWSGIRVFKIDNTLREVMVETAKTTSLVFIILLGAAMLTAAFRAFGGEELVREFLVSLPGGFWTQFVIVMAVIFILGFFLDFIEIAVVVVPIVAPILLADPSANITAVWLGVMIGLNIQTSFLTPPFGFALFYLRGVAPAVVKTVQMYKGVIAFIFLQLAALGIVAWAPSLVNYLPNRASLLSDNAPPPRNPRLAYCVDQYVAGELAVMGSGLLASVENIKSIDLSMLPRKLRSDVEKAFDAVPIAISSLEGAQATGQSVLDATADYRPIHTMVRNLQREMRGFDQEIKILETSLGRIRTEEGETRRAGYEEKIAEFVSERDEIAALIPADWDDTYAAFSDLQKEETDTYRKFSRAASDSYVPIGELIAILQSGDAFRELETRLIEARAQVETSDPEAMIDPLNDLGKAFGAVDGADDVQKAVSAARRALKARTPDKEKALAQMDKALEAYAEQAEWRPSAESTLLEPLSAYQDGMRSTLGIREQENFTRDQALYVAGCLSNHRDISLNF